MSFARLPLFRPTLLRSIHTTRTVSVGQSSLITNTTSDKNAIDPTPSSGPDTSSVGAPHPADVVAGKVVGPITERLTSSEIAAETINGAPNALLHRQVRIYQPTKSTMQSAKGKTKRWVLDWDVLSGAGRWENPLMGWASSADYMQGTNLFFKTREGAVAFAEKQGWDYMVQEPKRAKIPPKNYAGNYVHVPGKLRIHHTK